MTLTVKALCGLIALICFVVAACGVPTNRFSAGWIGMIFFMAIFFAPGG